MRRTGAAVALAALTAALCGACGDDAGDAEMHTPDTGVHSTSTVMTDDGGGD